MNFKFCEMIKLYARQITAIIVLTSSVFSSTSAAAAPLATPSNEEQAIRATLIKWTDAFNAGDKEHVYSLFAEDLKFDFYGFPERNYQQIQALLQSVLDDPSKRYHYACHIKEIIVSGDLAVVRLGWTLTATPTGLENTNENKPPASIPSISKDNGLDVFRKQSDGSWKIIRFMAFDVPVEPSKK